MIDGAIDWAATAALVGVVTAGVALLTLVTIVWLAIRDRPRLRSSLRIGTVPDRPAWQQQIPALFLTIRNYGAATILRRGWVRWGPGSHEISWNLPVADLAIPGGGLLLGGGPPVEVAISLNDVSEATRLRPPLEIGVEDRNGYSVGMSLPDSFVALFPSSPSSGGE